MEKQLNEGAVVICIGDSITESMAMAVGPLPKYFGQLPRGSVQGA